MENFEKKMRMKSFLECVKLGGKEGKQLVSLNIFSLSPPKYFLLKIKRKLREDAFFS